MKTDLSHMSLHGNAMYRADSRGDSLGLWHVEVLQRDYSLRCILIFETYMYLNIQLSLIGKGHN